MPFLQIKQRQAVLDLEMLRVLEFKSGNWKRDLLRLKQEISFLNNQPVKDVDISTLE